jgi:hypothetical protein
MTPSAATHPTKAKEDVMVMVNEKDKEKEASRPLLLPLPRKDEVAATTTKEAPLTSTVATTLMAAATAISSFIVVTTIHAHAISQLHVSFKDTMSAPTSVSTKRMKMKESIFRRRLGGGAKAK